jgi:hypothetical protein
LHVQTTAVRRQMLQTQHKAAALGEYPVHLVMADSVAIEGHKT